ncbi:MAG: transcriptional repressor, partial [Cyanobacteria bacterium P01_H01_bin.74]
MRTYTDFVITHLKKLGFRITKQRRLVAEVLDRVNNPLSAYDIKDLLQEHGETIDTVSIYRILDCFEENQLIHRVLATGKVVKCNLEGETHCQVHHKDRCHYLLICNHCGQ